LVTKMSRLSSPTMLSKCSIYLTLQRRNSLWLCLEKKDCWGWKCCWEGGIQPVYKIPSFDTSYKPRLLGTNKTPYLRSHHTEEIHIQKSRTKKQAWFLLNPFCNAGGCVYWGEWNPICNIKDAMYWWNFNPFCNIWDVVEFESYL
jgi:hypothetical protein